MIISYYTSSNVSRTIFYYISLDNCISIFIGCIKYEKLTSKVTIAKIAYFLITFFLISCPIPFKLLYALIIIAMNKKK
jgi:hypothetical protein